MGSSATSDQSHTDYIPIGYVRKAHGIRGDVVVRGLVDDAVDRFAVDAALSTGEQPGRTLRVTSCRMTGDDFLLHLSEIDTRNDAEALIGVQFVVNKSERRELVDDEWWVEDLIGCDVVDVDGRHLGTVADVVSGAAQDRLVVETTEEKLGEIPLVLQLVPEVDVAAGRITVDLPPGLFD
ncbi:MAG: ribosome maturation factor RimM [Acidimicrobiia bacterium]